MSSADDRLRAVLAELTTDRLVEAVSGLVDIPSPTGAERPVAEWAVGYLLAAGVRSELQVIDDRQANAVGIVSGDPQGPSLLLYAPLDTFTTGDPEHDVPWAASALRPDMLPHAERHGPFVSGLGAGNPKGHAAAVLVLGAALARSGIVPAGDVVLGLGAGGMPSFSVPGAGVPGRENTGHGVGATHLLERGYTTDSAIICKPGWAVAHDEVGLVWIDVTVPGIHTYVGSRHRLPYRNAVVLAGTVAADLEDWLEEYAATHESGTMRPQGVVSSVVGGFERLAAATTAAVRLRLDIRMTPEQTAGQVLRELRTRLAGLESTLGVELPARLVATVPGTSTDPGSPVIRATVAAWEAVTGQTHRPTTGTSGATDANILRMRGVPTARIGMPKVLQGPDGDPVDFSLGMNLVDVRELSRLVQLLARIVVDGAWSQQKNGEVR